MISRVNRWWWWVIEAEKVDFIDVSCRDKKKKVALQDFARAREDASRGITSTKLNFSFPKKNSKMMTAANTKVRAAFLLQERCGNEQPVMEDIFGRPGDELELLFYC